MPAQQEERPGGLEWFLLPVFPLCRVNEVLKSPDTALNQSHPWTFGKFGFSSGCRHCSFGALLSIFIPTRHSSGTCELTLRVTQAGGITACQQLVQLLLLLLFAIVHYISKCVCAHEVCHWQAAALPLGVLRKEQLPPASSLWCCFWHRWDTSDTF